MKDGFVSIRTEAHARLIVRRASKNTIRTPNMEIVENGSLSKANASGLVLNIRGPSVNSLDEPSPTSTKDKHSTVKAHPSSTKINTMEGSPSAGATTEALVSRSHVSGVAIGLAFGLIGFAALIIVIVWAVRRHKAKLFDSPVARWKRNPFADMENMNEKPETGVHIHRQLTKKSEGYSRLKDEKLLSAPVSGMSSIRSDAHSSFLVQSMVVTPPENTLNNPVRPTSAISVTSVDSVIKQREFAKVLRGFLPTLPDELQIHQGEVIEVINSFDDGWALCLNQQREKGVVPFECLSRDWDKDELSPPDGSRGAYRLSKRASSLYAGISLDTY